MFTTSGFGMLKCILVTIMRFVGMILQVLVKLILVQMGEHALHRTQPTIHVVVLLVLLVLTAVQTSTFVSQPLVLMAVHASKDMVQQLLVFVLKDLLAQDAKLIFHSVG